MCENSRRRSGGAAAAAAAADLRHVNILPPLRSVMRIQCSGESSRLAEARRRRRRRRSRKKSNPARVHKVISSSGIKQTKQSYTSCNLSDCLHARTFLSTPPTPHTHSPMFVSVTGRPQSTRWSQTLERPSVCEQFSCSCAVKSFWIL